MAWRVQGDNLTIVEGDYGLELPVTVTGTTFTLNDTIRITFKRVKNGDAILVKEYTPDNKGTVNLELTEAESALFMVGTYVYCLDWYQDGAFMCNIIPAGTFKVVDKA